MANAKDNFCFAHFNIRSLCSQFDAFREFVGAEGYDIIGLSETWLHSAILTENIEIPNYTLIRKDRDSRGGGVAFYINKCLKFNILEVPPQASLLEELWISVKINNKTFCFGSLYRPPNVNLNACLDDLENSITNFLPSFSGIIFGGDFNINCLDEGSPGFNHLNRLLNKYSLSQLIKLPTRISQSNCALIDLIVSSFPELSTDVQVIDMDTISDHYLVYTQLKFQKQKVPITYRTYRDYSNFVFQDFLSDLFGVQWDLLLTDRKSVV